MHAMFQCQMWVLERMGVEEGGELEPETMASCTLQSEDRWKVIERFMSGLIKKKDSVKRFEEN